MIASVRCLALALLLVGPGFAQLQICDGLNHANTTITGSWGLPSARTLGVRYVPATTFVVERVEWFFSPSTLGSALGGTISVILEDPMTGLPSTDPMDVVGQAQWSGTTNPPNWDGATFNTPILFQGSTPYWLATTASPTTTHQAPSYDDGGPDATPYAVATGGTWVLISTPHRFKVRLMSGSCSGTPVAEYQVNQPAASSDVNGVQGTTTMPAEVVLSVGQAGVLSLSSSLSTVWDVGYGLLPLVPASAGGLTLADGQIVNVNVADPSFGFLFTPPLNSPPFVITAVPVNTAAPLALSFQLILLNPSTPTGVSLSQGNRLVVQ